MHFNNNRRVPFKISTLLCLTISYFHVFGKKKNCYNRDRKLGKLYPSFFSANIYNYPWNMHYIKCSNKNDTIICKYKSHSKQWNMWLHYLILSFNVTFLFPNFCFRLLLLRFLLNCLIFEWVVCFSVKGLVATICEWIKLKIHINENGINNSINDIT